jgi:NAD(P)-dependent dehydrogenase (short-subunit alcohol dehydrogenase family)
MYRSAFTPARVVRLMRAPSLAASVTGRVVLVTGASSGIGRATAQRLGAAGATVLLVARRTEALTALEAEIAAVGGTAHVHPCDLRDLEAVDRLAAEIMERYGRIDVLVNNAGRSIRRSIDQSYDRAHDFERTMQLNYFAALHLILALLPSMRERRSGHIINVSTMGVLGRPPRWSAYVASKAALDAFSNCLAVEVLGDDVHVTNIYFPLVHTPMVAPTGIYDGAPGLTAEEAATMIDEAIRTKAPRISPRLGVLFQTAWLIAPATMQRMLSRFYARSLARSASVPLAEGAAHADSALAESDAGAEETRVA